MLGRCLLLCTLLVACSPERKDVPKPELEGQEQLKDLQGSFMRKLRTDPDSALVLAGSHMDLALTLGDSLAIAKGENMQGMVLLLKGDRALALEHFLRALEGFEALGETKGQALLHGNIADALQGTRSSKRANWHLRRSIDLYTAAGDSAWAAGMMQVLATALLSSGERDSAMILYADARTLHASERSGVHAAMAIMDHITRHADTLTPQVAIGLYRDALQVLQNGDAPMRSTILIKLGRALLHTGSIDEAGPVLEEALAIAERTGLIDTRADAHYALNLYNRAIHRQDLALEHMDHYLILRDSIGSEERLKAMLEAEQRYAGKEKDAELQRNQVLLARRSQVIKATSVAGALAVVAGIIAVWAYLQKKRSNAELSAKNLIIEQQLREKEVLLREVHHRVKNNLQSVSSLLRLQARTVRNDDARNALQEAIARIKSILLIHQDLYRTSDLTRVDMSAYLHKLSTALNRDHGTQERVQVELQIAPVLLEVEAAVPIGLITNELITNALKHAFPEDRTGHVIVRLREEGDTLTLEVRDDGVGIPDEVLAHAEREELSGVGIVSSLVSSMGAEHVITHERGTLVRVRIPDPRGPR